MTSDWREVYRQEKRRPGYVIENGKSVAKDLSDASPRRDVTPLQRDKRKAA
jgi:hypothetical protein